MNIQDIVESISKKKFVPGNVLTEIFLGEITELIVAKNWKSVFLIAEKISWSQTPFIGAVILIYHAFNMNPGNVLQELPKFLVHVDLKDRFTAANLNVIEEFLSLPCDILYQLSGRKD
jgi:hypothetical protein